LAIFKDNRPRGYVITGAGAAEGIRIVSVVKSVAGTVTESVGRKTPGLDDKVLDNCLAVQKAAVAFAAGNDGEYARDIDEVNLDGKTLIDLLPGGAWLTNPSTGAATEPTRDWWPSGSGSTVYERFFGYDENWDWHVFGYRIVGRGEFGEVVLTNASQIVIKEQTVIKNCLNIRAAVEAWTTDNGGVYPANLSDVTGSGDTVIDYLPMGWLLVNPFTFARTEPVYGMAAANGSTGFLSLDANGDGTMDGYQISGVGANIGAGLVYLFSTH
jgi:hypothetical protein